MNMELLAAESIAGEIPGGFGPSTNTSHGTVPHSTVTHSTVTHSTVADDIISNNMG